MDDLSFTGFWDIVLTILVGGAVLLSVAGACYYLGWAATHAPDKLLACFAMVITLGLLWRGATDHTPQG